MRFSILLLCLYPFFVKGQIKKDPIKINHADVLDFNKNYANAERLIGHVSMTQGNTTLTCDSAWFWKEENKLEAYGHAYLIQTGGVSVWSDYMLYDGNSKMALAKNNVRLSDNKMSLTTDLINYNVNQKIAYYTTGGEILDGQNKMISKSGAYHVNSAKYFFKGDIVLTNPEYTMESDTLDYHGNTKTAFFYGPTLIKSDDNLLFCNYGWYNTQKNTCQFSKRAYIISKENRIDSDSFLYNRNTGIGHAFGNIKLSDTLQKIVIYGDKGLHKRFEKTTLISGNASAFKEFEEDTVFIKAGYFYDKLDTSTRKRTLSAFNKAKIYKSDIQGIGDSICYRLSDSLINFFNKPVLWNESNQTTGDTINIYQKKNTIDKMDVIQNAMIIIEEDSSKYNQIKGRKIYGFFSNSALYKVDVKGNGQSVYYAKEDSVNYSGVNFVECTNMIIRVDSNRVKKVTFLIKPQGTFYPLEDFPEEKKKLKGFSWEIDRRPRRSDF